MTPHAHHRPWTILQRTGALGDFILTLPLLRHLCDQHRPLALITRPAYQALLPPDVQPDVVISCDSPALAHLSAPTLPPPPGLRTPHPVFCTRNQQRLDLWTLWADARVLVFAQPDANLERNLRACGVRTVTWIPPRPATPPHAALHFLHAAGAPADARLLATAQWPLPPQPVANDGRTLWLHPGSGGLPKNWPLEHFVQFAKDWQRQHDGRPVIVSVGEADAAIAAQAPALFRQHGVAMELLGGMDLDELKRALSTRAGQFIGNDSGVTHLAGALGLPTLALFRASAPAIWHPLGPHVKIREYPTANTQ